MSFWTRLKDFNLNLILTIFISTFLVVFAQSFLVFYSGSTDDFVRILSQFLVFMVTLLVGGMAKIFFFYFYGKALKLFKKDSLWSFTSRVFSEWVVVEVRVQLRTLFYLLLLIIPGVIEALRLSLSSVYVFFSPNMKDEEFDPVFASRDNITLKQKLILLVLFTLNALTLGLQLTLMNASFFVSGESFLKAVLNLILMTLITYFYYIYIAHIYFHFEKDTHK